MGVRPGCGKSEAPAFWPRCQGTEWWGFGYWHMDEAVRSQSLETTVARLHEESRRAKAVLAAASDIAPHRLRALRIRLRTFLDGHRRVLPRGEAVALRALIDDVDRALERL